MEILTWWFTLVNSPLPVGLQLINIIGSIAGIFPLIVGGWTGRPVITSLFLLPTMDGKTA